ncbi:S-adenosyl-L-methionine-dependent methyltransferase [Balamuthia mandrillaris]
MGIDKRWLLGGGVLYAGAAGAGYWYTRRAKFPSASAPTDDERMGTFDKIADRYDSDIDLDERAGGILKWRRRLLVDGGKARGRVLEVGAGTGRNIEHYMASPACTEVVLTDRSAEMLEEAIKKYNELSLARKPARALG